MHARVEIRESYDPLAKFAGPRIQLDENCLFLWGALLCGNPQRWLFPPYHHKNGGKVCFSY
jgi:hypothetical protein